MEEITLGSLFDGIGGFPYAASFYGIRALWASEIVPECVSVTKRHFPGMAHVGDITRLHGGELAPVDIITFGSPCQGLSVAGLRRGFHDERSGLFMEAVRIINEMKEATDGRYPEFALWENVPGALSSAGGRDYQAVLEAFTKAKVPMPGSGKWADAGMVRGGSADIAWVVYDAQYFGTAQRRRRLFLVADLTAGRSAEILFVPKSLRGYFEAGGTPRQGLAAFAEGGAGGAGRGDSGRGGGLTGEGAGPCVYCIVGNIIGRKPPNGGNGRGCQKELSYTLTAMDRHAVNVPVAGQDGRTLDGDLPPWAGEEGHMDGTAVRDIEVLNDQGGSSMTVERPGLSPTLRSQTHGNLPVVAERAGAWRGRGSGAPVCMATGQGHAEILRDLSPTLNCGHEQPCVTRTGGMGQPAGYIVRRLTPLECERLMGYQDGWTEKGHDGKPVSDSKRYQMLGNSIAVPCAAYIMQGICQALGRSAEPSRPELPGFARKPAAYEN